MKTILFLILAARCLGGSITLEWDANAEAEIAYTMEAQAGDGSNPDAWQPVKSTSETWAKIDDLAPGPWAFRVRAISKNGAVSAPSNVFTDIITPEAPANLRRKIALQWSPNMSDWQQIAVMEVPDMTRGFYRIEFTP